MEPDNEGLEDESLKEEWLRHPYAAVARKAFQNDAVTFHKQFVHACEATSDPKVASTFRKWADCMGMVEILTRKEE